MVRYSIVAPKIFADGGGDNKATANKALLSVGMDPDNFRTGHTKVMFRAGKLAELEDIREHALTKITIKMQCHSRRLLVKVVYDAKKEEKRALYSIQHNIRLYLTCRDWSWYKYYTMVKGESEKLKKKMAEEERRKQMAEGLAKFQATLDAVVAQREAAAEENNAKKEEIAALKASIEGLGSHALEQAEIIKDMNGRAEQAAKQLADTEAYIASERSSLQAYTKKTKEELNKQKTNCDAELTAAKDKFSGSANSYQSLKNKAIAIEAERTAMRGEIAAIADAISRVDKKATSALREKRESWQAISDIQNDVTTCVARASYLEKEGFEVDQAHLGALIKMHYKLHSYVTYKITKGKK
jgi:myosin heavy subunit